MGHPSRGLVAGGGSILGIQLRFCSDWSADKCIQPPLSAVELYNFLHHIHLAQMASLPAGNTVQLGHICSPVPFTTQLQIANAFWEAATPADYVPTSLQPYAEYYTEQRKTVYHSFGTNLPLSKHEEIIRLAQEIKQGLTRQQFIQSVEHGAVNLATRLLLMVDVGKPATNRLWTGRAFRSWDQGTINDFTASIFPVQRSNRHDGIRLDTDFNARNLDAIGGLKVELTNNLLDHLEVIDIEGETTVMIFHHASFLKNQEHPLFPDGFVDETLQTLALLFPQNKWYKASKAWYHKHFESAMADADPGCLMADRAATKLSADADALDVELQDSRALQAALVFLVE
ncbi:hypothetical protein EDB81DRAFT_915948 [Dactylonectria macrodidyma]|uniref:Uncharacterized protein n=1 Tax=Dactylonectria macrodidyma TaxID=307937 RepID=A0A9P9DDS0_9HYPO|nr:hypothetical protein EDB81DRAFT_915948 [Dactylonectria macrodidyma]